MNNAKESQAPNVGKIAKLLRKENTMPRDCEGFRAQMERLNEFFPDCELLSVTDVIRFTGRDRRTVVKLFNFRNNFISKVEVARTLS